MFSRFRDNTSPRKKKEYPELSYHKFNLIWLGKVSIKAYHVSDLKSDNRLL